MSGGPVSFGPFEVAEFYQAACLAALDACGSTAITTTYVGVGLSAYDDICGQLVVTPSNIFRSSQFPSEDTTLDQCDGATIAVQIDVALLRCVPTATATRLAPKPKDLADAHKLILDDAAIIWRAMSEPPPDSFEWDTALHRQVPINAQGGTAGIIDSIVVGVPASMWCIGGC